MSQKLIGGAVNDLIICKLRHRSVWSNKTVISAQFLILEETDYSPVVSGWRKLVIFVRIATCFGTVPKLSSAEGETSTNRLLSDSVMAMRYQSKVLAHCDHEINVRSDTSLSFSVNNVISGHWIEMSSLIWRDPTMNRLPADLSIPESKMCVKSISNNMQKKKNVVDVQ